MKIASQIFVKFRLISEEATSGIPFIRGCDTYVLLKTGGLSRASYSFVLHKKEAATVCLRHFLLKILHSNNVVHLFLSIYFLPYWALGLPYHQLPSVRCSHGITQRSKPIARPEPFINAKATKMNQMFTQ